MCIRDRLGKGAVVVTEAPGCKIRAVASVPDFSPLDLSEATQREDAPLVNRAFSAYAPGSVFKVAVAAALLEEGLGELTFTCVGSLNAGGLQFHCVNSTAHGAVSYTHLRRPACWRPLWPLLWRSPCCGGSLGCSCWRWACGSFFRKQKIPRRAARINPPKGLTLVTRPKPAPAPGIPHKRGSHNEYLRQNRAGPDRHRRHQLGAGGHFPV